MSKRSSGTPRASALAIAFFYEHGASSYDPKIETAEQGKQRSAERYAEAEALAREAGLSFEWCDSDIDSRDHDDSKPYYTLFTCICHDANGKVLDSLHGCDFGRDADGPYGPYRRVVEAEVALEALAYLELASHPTREQLEALIAWAEAHKHNWKSQLGAAWLVAGQGFPGYNMHLQQIRNNFGPTWLEGVRLAELKAMLARKSNRRQRGD